MLISTGSAAVIFLLAGLDRTPWRYSSVADHLQVVVLTVLAILLALVLTFALNRLEPVARSLPVLQGALIVSFLVFARSAARFWHTRQIHINGNGRVDVQSYETVLLVGVNTVTELFLLSVKEFASQRVQVAGILAEDPSMRGRAIQQKPVLGTVEELQDIVHSLEVHGVAVNKIVVATPIDLLRPSALESLFEVEKTMVLYTAIHDGGLEGKIEFDTSGRLQEQIARSPVNSAQQQSATRAYDDYIRKGLDREKRSRAG